jgi:uncharacterized membrane protein
MERPQFRTIALFIGAAGVGYVVTAMLRGGRRASPALTQAMTIVKPHDEVAEFFRDPERLATILQCPGEAMHLEIHERDRDLIAWDHAKRRFVSGAVYLHPAPADRGTEVHMTMPANPGMPATRMLRTLRAEDPKSQIKDVLRRAKSLLEAGEIPTGRRRAA